MRLCLPFAGLAPEALRVLWLLGGSSPLVRWEPPVSRCGAKTGFVVNEFRAFGLDRLDWSSVHLNDMCPVMHLLHLVYASSELRDAVARRVWAMVPCPSCLPDEVERALSGESRPTPATCQTLLAAHSGSGCPECNGTGTQDARRLWERARKEPVPMDVVDACAAGLYMQARSFSNSAVSLDDDGHWQASRDTSMSTCTFCPETKHSSFGAINPRPELASRLESLPSGFATLADVTARGLFLQSRSFQLRDVTVRTASRDQDLSAWSDRGYQGDDRPASANSTGETIRDPRQTAADQSERLPGMWVDSGYCPEIRDRGKCMKDANPRWALAGKLAVPPGPGNCQIGISRMGALEFVRLMELTADDVLVLDPPYLGDQSKPITGYAHGCSRTDVLEMARIGHRAGALVLLHEGVGLAGALGPGWSERSASPLRGRTSTFHAGGIEREWLTSNREPRDFAEVTAEIRAEQTAARKQRDQDRRGWARLGRLLAA